MLHSLPLFRVMLNFEYYTAAAAASVNFVTEFYLYVLCLSSVIRRSTGDKIEIN